MENLAEKTISEIVANDYRTAQIFSDFKIDFCCKGNRSVAEACAEKNINSGALLARLEQVKQVAKGSDPDFNDWPLDLLATYIEKKHHRYVTEKIPVISQFLDKLCAVHGKNHPELDEINSLFAASAGELTAHMKKEEFILFPHIHKMVNKSQHHSMTEVPHFGTVNNPIQMMMEEHAVEGARFEKIAALSDHYTPPADACNTYRVTYAMLNEFEEDLHLHIHLENNILFPKASLLEKELTADVV